MKTITLFSKREMTSPLKIFLPYVSYVICLTKYIYIYIYIVFGLQMTKLFCIIRSIGIYWMDIFLDVTQPTFKVSVLFVHI